MWQYKQEARKAYVWMCVFCKQLEVFLEEYQA